MALPMPWAQDVVNDLIATFNPALPVTYKPQAGGAIQTAAIIGEITSHHEDSDNGLMLVLNATFNLPLSAIGIPTIMDTITDELGHDWGIERLDQTPVNGRFVAYCTRSNLVTRFRRQTIEPVPTGDTGIIGQGIIGQTFRIGY